MCNVFFMKKAVKIAIYALLFIALTVLSQVGGVVLLCWWLLRPLFKNLPTVWGRRVVNVLMFGALMALSSFVLVPFIAKYVTGSVPLPILHPHLKPRNWTYPLLNRHYITPQVYATGTYTTNMPGYIGYGAFSPPQVGEKNLPMNCRKQGYWQYGITDYLTPDFSMKKVHLDQARMRHLLQLFAKEKSVYRLFLELHLHQRLKLEQAPKLRFHGCWAVRHDDHLHIDFR